MSEKIILSEKLEDNKAAAEWGIKQAELIKKGEEIRRNAAVVNGLVSRYKWRTA